MMLRPLAIRHYLAVMQSRGISATAVLQGTDVDAARFYDPSYLIDIEQCRTIAANMLRLSGDRGLGFDVGLSAELTDLGILGYAIMSCKTMRETVGLWVQYGTNLVGVMSGLEITRDDTDSLTFRIVELAPLGELYSFCVEEILTMVYKIGGMLAGAPPVVRLLELNYPAPPHAARYHELFGCAIRFGQPYTSGTVAREWLDRPLQSSDVELNRLCLQHCGQILRQIENSSPTASQLRNLFLKNPSTLPKLDAAAQELRMSARTLRRHLHEAGTSYQKLVEEFRRDLACEYLKSTALPPKEIAHLLGFKDQGGFRRAFKDWTGNTIREYRARALQV